MNQDKCEHEWGQNSGEKLCMFCSVSKSDWEAKQEDKKWLYEFSGRAMQGFLSSQDVNIHDTASLTECIMKQAKALLERLKKEEV